MELTIENGIVTSCNLRPHQTRVTIPEGVTAIGPKAFFNKKIKSISFPSTLTEIGAQAFWGCSELQEVKLPPSVVKIGYQAFLFCGKITAFYVPESVQICGGMELEWCKSLRRVHIYREDGVYAVPVPGRQLTVWEDEFGHDHHWQTESMLELLLAKNYNKHLFEQDAYVRMVGWMLYSGLDTGETENYLLANAKDFFDQVIEEENTEALDLIADSGKVIGELPEEIYQQVLSFAECDETLLQKLRNIPRLPERQEEFTIRDGVLIRYNRKASGTVAVIPDGVTAIGGSAFEKSERLERVVFPEGLKTIGHRAFRECPQLRTAVPASLRNDTGKSGLVLPEGVTAIGDRAFESCILLESAELPSALQSISNRAFADCRKLKDFVISASVAHLGSKILNDTGSLECITLFKHDGKRFSFPDVQKDGMHYDMLQVLLKRNFKVRTYEPFLTQLLCRMLVSRFDNGETAAYILANKKNFLQNLFQDDKALQLLLQSGLFHTAPISQIFDEMILYTNQTRNYEMQLLLMNTANEQKNGAEEERKRLNL